MSYTPPTDAELMVSLVDWCNKWIHLHRMHLQQAVDEMNGLNHDLRRVKAEEEDYNRRAQWDPDLSMGLGMGETKSQILERQKAQCQLVIDSKATLLGNAEAMLKLVNRTVGQLPPLDADEAELLEFKADKAGMLHARTLVGADADCWPMIEFSWKAGWKAGYQHRKVHEASK